MPLKVYCVFMLKAYKLSRGSIFRQIIMYQFITKGQTDNKTAELMLMII